MSEIPITVLIPVRNEEENLTRCLAQLRNFSEVIVVDSQSTDSTQEIAEQSGAKVVQFNWNGQFPKKRNWALRNVEMKNDWILFLDADEFLTDAATAEIAKAVESDEYVGYWLNFRNHFMGKVLRFGYPLRKLALFRKDAGEYEKILEDRWSDLDMEVHEQPVLEGKTGVIRSKIVHMDYRGISHYIQKHNEYSDWEAERYFSVKENWSLLRLHQKIKYRLLGSWFLAPLFFIHCYFLKLGCLDGVRGLIVAILKAIYFFQIKLKINEKKAACLQKSKAEMHSD